MEPPEGQLQMAGNLDHEIPLPVIEVDTSNGGRLKSIFAAYEYKHGKTPSLVDSSSTLRTAATSRDKETGEPLAKRRRFSGAAFDFSRQAATAEKCAISGGVLRELLTAPPVTIAPINVEDHAEDHASPMPTNGGKIPSTPQAPARKKAIPRYNSRSVRTTRASTYYANTLKEGTDTSAPTTTTPLSNSRGQLFMGSTQSTDQSDKPQRLFFNLGQNLYVDKQIDKTGSGEMMLRLSLWHTNAINKLQRAGSRYSILLNLDAIYQIMREADDIKLALSLSDDQNFFGYSLMLGRLKFLTVEPDMCSVSMRHWYQPAHQYDQPAKPDLRPCREGIRMSYDQFKRFIEFLDVQVHTEFPSYASYVFCCDRDDHDPDACSMCYQEGVLPIQREFQRLLDDCW